MTELDGLYYEYADMVKRFLIGLTGSIDLSEELTQETFYQAVRSIDRYDGTCKISVWLCQIAKYQYYNYVKKRRRCRTLYIDGDISDMLTLPSDKSSVEDIVADREEVRYLLKCIDLIYEPYGKVFMLRVYGELSFREIGDIFGKTENWARVTFYRAKEKLRRKADFYESNV